MFTPSPVPLLCYDLFSLFLLSGHTRDFFFRLDLIDELRCSRQYTERTNIVCRSQWPRGLRRRSAPTRLLRLWVRIPQGHGHLYVVSVVCCQVEVTATS